MRDRAASNRVRTHAGRTLARFVSVHRLARLRVAVVGALLCVDTSDELYTEAVQRRVSRENPSQSRRPRGPPEATPRTGVRTRGGDYRRTPGANACLLRQRPGDSVESPILIPTSLVSQPTESQYIANRVPHSDVILSRKSTYTSESHSLLSTDSFDSRRRPASPNDTPSNHSHALTEADSSRLAHIVG